MSISWMTTVWERAPVKDAPLLILLAIADAANEDGAAYPAVSTLADRARVSRRYAATCLRQLEALGILHTDQGQGGAFDAAERGPGGRSVYTLTDPDGWPERQEEAQGARKAKEARQALRGRISGATRTRAPHGGDDLQIRGGDDPQIRGGDDPQSIPPLISRSSKPPFEPSNQPSLPPAASGDQAEAFAEFWDAYPRKEARANARQAWEKAVRGGASPSDLRQAAKRFAMAMKDEGRAVRFIPMAGRWISEEEWLVHAAPEGEFVSEAEARYNNFVNMVNRGKYRWRQYLEHYNRPEILLRAVQEGHATADELTAAGWDVPTLPFGR